MLVHYYYQYIPLTDTINKLAFLSPKTLEEAADFLMRMNTDVRLYGCIYYLTDKSTEEGN
jgi:hypothetical protein